MEPYRNNFSDNKAVRKLFENNYFDAKPETNSVTEIETNGITRHFNLNDSCTQTSKTIIQLAELEIAGQFVDSLNNTPRRGLKGEWKETTNVEEKSERINGSRETLKLGKSLTERFLENRSKRNWTSSPVKLYENFQFEETSDNPVESRSKFLMQSSLLNRMSSIPDLDYPHREDHTPPARISRFTVKQTILKDFTETSIPVEQCSKFNSIKKLDRSRMTAKVAPGKQTVTVNRAETIPKPLQPKKSSPKSGQTKKFGRSNSFMLPTIASLNKSQKPVVSLTDNLISPTRRGRSVSPALSSCPSPERETPRTDTISQCTGNPAKIPYIDRSPVRNRKDAQLRSESCFVGSSSPKSHFRLIKQYTSPRLQKLEVKDNPLYKSSQIKKIEDTLQINKLKIANKDSIESMASCSSKISTSVTSTSSESSLETILAKFRNSDWSVALQALAEITGLCRMLDPEILYPYMPNINRRLLELLRSPRSHVCRTACQAAGHFFETMKDTRRPEFDDIVDILLCKTADANKFIRQDANLSLDCMVTHVPTFHTIRALCTKGPTHKNNLVRTATIRLIVCAVVISGADFILSASASECNKKRVIGLLPKFFNDTCHEARKYAERLYKVLHKHPNFEACLRKYVDKEVAAKLKSCMKSVYKSNLGSFLE